MRTTLSPAGKQPVRIAYRMAIAPDINVATKSQALVADLRKVFNPVGRALRRACSTLASRENLLLATASASAISAFFSGVAFSVSESPASCATLAVSAAVCFAAIAISSSTRKGGKA